MEQKTLPKCNDPLVTPTPVRILLNHASIKIYTASSFDVLANSVALAAYPRHPVSHVRWNLATFKDSSPILIITFRLKSDKPEYPDRSTTYTL